MNRINVNRGTGVKGKITGHRNLIVIRAAAGTGNLAQIKIQRIRSRQSEVTGKMQRAHVGDSAGNDDGSARVLSSPDDIATALQGLATAQDKRTDKSADIQGRVIFQRDYR